MTHDIQADFDTLLRQSWLTAHDYMLHAKIDIDEMFGEGYAAKHPDLVAAYMRTAAKDFSSTMQKLGTQDLDAALLRLSDSFDSISASIALLEK